MPQAIADSFDIIRPECNMIQLARARPEHLLARFLLNQMHNRVIVQVHPVTAGCERGTLAFPQSQNGIKGPGQLNVGAPDIDVLQNGERHRYFDGGGVTLPDGP